MVLSFLNWLKPSWADNPSDDNQEQDPIMWLFVGLGNPGAQYAMHRHNIGFMAVDAIAENNNLPAFKKKYQGQYTEGNIGGVKIGLLKPETYMNNSGQSVGAAAKFYKLPIDKIFVFHDELDLPPGKLKIKKGGGLAGHNGLKSIKAHMGSDDFWRVRMGIGHPGAKNLVSGYVLHNFAKEDETWLVDVLSVIGSYSDLLLEDNHSAFMNKLPQ